MITRLVLLASAIAVLSFAACGDDDDDGAATPATAVATATTAERTATNPAATATAAATSTKPATVPADGTVDPLGAGQTTPWTVKALPENATGGLIVLEDVRMGVHPEQGGWERIVFEFKGPNRPAATIEYVNQAVACGSGQPVTLQGTAILQVRIASAAAHDDSGKLTIESTDMKGPGNTILQAKGTCDFEGVVVMALGLKGKQNFKVTTLTSPTRIVVDIKQ